MAKFFLGVILGIVIAVFGSIIVLFAIGRIFANKQPTVAGNSVLILDLQGEIPEAAPVDIPFPLGRASAPPTVRDLWTSLKEAAKDQRVKAIVLEPRGIGAGWAKLQEVRHELVEFKKSGKPVYAYLQSPGSREYYLASVADKIYVSPDDMVDVKGFLLEEMYFKNSLDKLGVQVEVDHIGKFKDAGDPFTKSNMSPETREVLNQVLDQIYNDFCSSIGQSRHMTADQVKALIDAGPFLGTQAKANGLIDELSYEDQIFGDLKKRTGGDKDLAKVSIRTYFKAKPGSGDRIAVLVGEGDIVRGDAQDEGFGGSGGNISSGGFAKVIRQVRNDSSIKGVIVRVDSPGGDSVASDEILHELKMLSAAKPMAISMSDYAASGGYFISMTGDPIVSYPDTLTGSIGVLYIRPNLHGLFDKLGIQEDQISRGKLANLDDTTQPLSDAGRQKLHDSIEATYKSFVGKVAVARKKNFGQIDALGQGHVWMGAQAKDNGLVDQLGGLDEAVEIVRKKAGLSAGGETNLVLYPARRSLLEMLSNATPEALEEAATERKIRAAVPGLPSQQVLKGGVMQILPFSLNVR
jgi:protease-4